STGLNALVLARRKAEAGSGELRLVGACPMVRKVLRITGLDKVFPVHATVEEAIGPRPAAQHNGMVVQVPAQSELRV
ncbi:MAG: STAS domain-containing protein, partial [Nocardioides sp.]